jgi:hypothetical protein
LSFFFKFSLKKRAAAETEYFVDNLLDLDGSACFILQAGE